MDLNATLDIIIKDLHDVRDIIDDLKKYPGVPALQIELAKSKCKSAAEVIALLKDLHEKLNAGTEEKQEREERMPEKKVEITVKNEPVRAERKEEFIEEKVIPVVNFAMSTPEESRRELSQVHNMQAITPEMAIVPKPAVKKHVENSILADQFNNMGESFNEKLASLKHEDDVSDILKTKPVSNLSEAIGINDRFLFIREIFNGDAESYNDVIHKLNSAGNINDATALITAYTRDDTDADALRQLMDLLKRKFHSNE